MDLDILCPMCVRFDEDGTGTHVFIRCKEVRIIWESLGMQDEGQIQADCARPKEVLHLMLSWDTSKQIMYLALLCTWRLTHSKVNAGERKKTNINDTPILYQIGRNAADYEMFCLKKQHPP